MRISDWSSDVCSSDLEDATLENGCLWALPGAHKGPLRERWRRKDGALAMERLDDTPWPQAGVPLEAPKGTLVVLHGKLPHGSGPNRSARSRHDYTMHLITGACAYPADNWLQRGPELPLRGFHVRIFERGEPQRLLAR